MRYGYARVSTDDQNLNLQLDALNAAGCNGRIFTDKLSGKSRKRPGLEDLLSQIGQDDTLVVWRLDRIGRNFRDLVDIADELRERGANLISLSEGIDTSSSIGEVIYRLMIVFADFERKVIVERTIAGLAAAKARGVRLGRRPKLSCSMVSELRLAIANGLSKAEAAKKFRVGRTTLYRYLDERSERCVYVGTPKRRQHDVSPDYTAKGTL